MDKADLLASLARIDGELRHPAAICVYGSAALILLDEPGRTSLDVDVAGPYSQADFAAFERAARAAGLPVNPPESYEGDHIEWVSALRLCLPRPSPETEIVLWQGSRLTVKTVAVPQLVASKLIRYDEIDQADVQYLCSRAAVEHASVEEAVRTLPPPFDRDPVVREKLDNLRDDLESWRAP